MWHKAMVQGFHRTSVWRVIARRVAGAEQAVVFRGEEHGSFGGVFQVPAA
jgi:hypothetical protein